MHWYEQILSCTKFDYEITTFRIMGAGEGSGGSGGGALGAGGRKIEPVFGPQLFFSVKESILN